MRKYTELIKESQLKHREMSRLTKRNKDGIAYLAITETLSKADQEIEGSKTVLEGIYAIFQKLAEYEDIGLIPAEVREIKKTLDSYNEVFIITEKLINIAEPDDLEDHYIRECFVISEGRAFIGFLKGLKNIGKTIFFNREEAEEQLKKFNI